jgi:hypothetical protein
LVAGSKVAVTVPVPADWFGGTSVVPLMVVLKLTVAARDGVADPSKTAPATPPTQ